MTGLVLKLKPFERLLVNGAVLQNGPRATRLRVRTSGASILRLRDALHPRDVATTAGKLYYMAQLAVAGEADPDLVKLELLALMTAIDPLTTSAEEHRAYARARAAARSGKLYAVMRAVKPLIDVERKPAE